VGLGGDRLGLGVAGLGDAHLGADAQGGGAFDRILRVAEDDRLVQQHVGVAGAARGAQGVGQLGERLGALGGVAGVVHGELARLARLGVAGHLAQGAALLARGARARHGVGCDVERPAGCLGGGCEAPLRGRALGGGEGVVPRLHDGATR
jgi:hypothetical protein